MCQPLTVLSFDCVPIHPCNMRQACFLKQLTFLRALQYQRAQVGNQAPCVISSAVWHKASLLWLQCPISGMRRLCGQLSSTQLSLRFFCFPLLVTQTPVLYNEIEQIISEIERPFISEGRKLQTLKCFLWHICHVNAFHNRVPRLLTILSTGVPNSSLSSSQKARRGNDSLRWQMNISL